jgi:hypothetical protein
MCFFGLLGAVYGWRGRRVCFVVSCGNQAEILVFYTGRCDQIALVLQVCRSGMVDLVVTRGLWFI